LRENIRDIAVYFWIYQHNSLYPEVLDEILGIIQIRKLQYHSEFLYIIIYSLFDEVISLS